MISFYCRCTISSEGDVATWLEMAILQHCHQHYQKTSVTQFGHGPMQASLWFNGFTTAAYQILEGTLFENTDEGYFPAGVKEFVAAMAISQRTQQVSQNQPRNSDRKLQETNKRFEEAISTSLRGRHLVGHYKAALQDTELITSYALILNMPVNTGFSQRRWQQATSVVLEKDKGDPKKSSP